MRGWIALVAVALLSACSPGGRHTASSTLVAAGPGVQAIEGAPPAGTTGGNPAIVSNIMQTRCDKCHGPNSAGAAGIKDIENLYEQVVSGRVVPGHPELSTLYQMAAGKGPCGPSLSGKELKTISDWIDSLPETSAVGQ